MSGLIWIQTVLHSDGIPERFFLKKLIKKYPQTTKKRAKTPSMQRVNNVERETPNQSGLINLNIHIVITLYCTYP